MVRNSTVTRLKRLKAMDYALANGVLFVGALAKQWNVSKQTVKGDLAFFRAKGQRIRKWFIWELSEYRYGYEPGVERHFAKELDE